MQTLQLFRDALGDSIDERPVSGVITELAVGEAEKDRRLCAQRLGGAPRFFLPSCGERLASWRAIGTLSVPRRRSRR